MLEYAAELILIVQIWLNFNQYINFKIRILLLNSKIKCFAMITYMHNMSFINFEIRIAPIKYGVLNKIHFFSSNYYFYIFAQHVIS